MRTSRRRHATDQICWFLVGLCASGIVSVPPLSSGAVIPGMWVWPRVGVASWYSQRDPAIHRVTASGEPFRDDRLTAAMWGVPFHSCVEVTALKTMNRVTVRINDRGPHRWWVFRGRLIDLSPAAFAKLGLLRDGLLPVQVELTDPSRCIESTPTSSG